MNEVHDLEDATSAVGDRNAIRDEAELESLLGEPSDLVRAKVGDRLDHLTRRFVERSPFVLLVDRSELPSSGEIHRARDASFDAEAYDAERAERYARREGFS